MFNHREKDYMEKIKSLYPEGLELIMEMLANVNLDKDLYLLKWKKGRIVVYNLLNRILNRGILSVLRFFSI